MVALQATAQKTGASGIITGSIIDAETNKGIALAVIKLVLMPDSSSKTIAATTGKDGNFEIVNLAYGYYRLKITHTSYQPITIDSIYIRKDRFDFNVGDIKLSTKTTDLENVIVYVEKPLIENKDGKLIYNVGESALSAGSTTAEILKNMPLVSNDPNGKILLKGKEPKILIDDKPVELTAAQLNDLLESLPGHGVDRIEVITNPTNEYANEQGGVINIVTKKGKIGTTGNIIASAGSRGEGSVNMNVSNRNKGLNISGGISLNTSQISNTSYSKRENIYTDSSNYYNTTGQAKNSNTRPNIRLQIDYETKKKHIWGLQINMFGNSVTNAGLTTYSQLNQYEALYKLSTRQNNTTGNNWNLNIQPAYTWKGKKPGETLRIVAGYVVGSNRNSRDYYQQFYNPNTKIPNGVDSTQNQTGNNDVATIFGRINYDKPMRKKGWRYSVGGTWNGNMNKNQLNTFFLKKPENVLLNNALLSSNFKFAQHLYTARVGLTGLINKKLHITTNLQLEETNFSFNFLSNNTSKKNNYWNLLPSITIRQDFSAKANISAVYRKTVRRPGIGELNPAIDYNDPYNLRFGNTELSPSVAHNYSLTYSATMGKSYINTVLAYNKITNIFSTIRSLEPDGKTYTTYKNIDNRNEYELSVWGGHTFSKMVRVNASAGYTYNQYGNVQKKLYRYQDGASYYTALNYNLLFSNVFNMDGNFRFSSVASPQGKTRSNLTMNIGVQHKFVQRRLAIGFNITDPFRTTQLLTYTYGTNFILENFNSAKTKNYRLSISWQLNKPVAPKKRK
jgi:ferric enterobactin receptor